MLGLASACSEPAERSLDPAISYRLTAGETPGSIQVVMTLSPGPQRKVPLRWPPEQFGPFTNLRRGIVLGNIEGGSIEVIEGAETLLLVREDSSKPTRLHYRLEQLYAGAPHDRLRVFWPALQPNYWYFSTTAALLAPVWSDPFRVTLSFEPPRGQLDWKLVSSRGVRDDCGAGCQIEFTGDEGSELQADVGEALMFMFGRVALRHKVLFPEDAERRNDLYVSIYGLPDYAESEEALLEGLEQIVQTHQAYWGDPVHPFFVVNIIGFGNNEPNNFGGFNASQIFNSFVPQSAMDQAWADGDRMLPQTNWVGLLSHVAHEYGHTWIDPALLDVQREPPENFGWLLEGATEYRADRVLLSAGLIDMPGYTQRFNQKLARYDGPYRSARSANLEAIVAGFWTGDYAIQRQPYLRGNLLAHDWNARILQSGDPDANFDALLREWIEQGRRQPLDSAQLDSLSRKYLKDGILADVRRHWFEGATVPLEADALGPCFSLQENDGIRQFKRFDEITQTEWQEGCLKEPPGWTRPRPGAAVPFSRAPASFFGQKPAWPRV